MHEASRSIIAALGVVHGHVFPYSPRPRTPAARMPQVGADVARARARDLREAVARERSQWLASLIGTELSVLAERGGSGHSAQFAPVRLTPGTRPGALLSLVPARVVEGMLE